MKRSGGSYIGTTVLALLVLALVAPILIALSHALLPILIIGAIAAIACRLAWFHTRRF